MDKLLLYHLHGVNLVIFLQPHQEDLGVASAPDDSDEVEVLQPQPLRDFDPIHPIDDRLKVLGRGPEKGGGTMCQNPKTLAPNPHPTQRTKIKEPRLWASKGRSWRYSLGCTRVQGVRGGICLVKLQAWACSVRRGSPGTCSTRVENAEPALYIALLLFSEGEGREWCLLWEMLS